MKMFAELPVRVPELLPPRASIPRYSFAALWLKRSCRNRMKSQKTRAYLRHDRLRVVSYRAAKEIVHTTHDVLDQTQVNQLSMYF